jgi:pyruvate carboxylase
MRYTLILTNYSVAMAAGVPVVPGTPGPVAAYTEASQFIEEYGFPGKCLFTSNADRK